MKLPSSIPIALLTLTFNFPLCFTFTVPVNTVDGFYGVPIDAHGAALKEVTLITSLADIQPFSKVEEQQVNTTLTERWLPPLAYACKLYNMNANDYASAYVNLYQICQNHWVTPNWAYYIKIGQAVVYSNYGGWNPCWMNELDEAFQQLIGVCPPPRGLDVWIQDWCKGYERSRAGEGICSWNQIP